MIQETMARLQPLASPSDIWIVTNKWLLDVIGEQLPEIPTKHIISEPCSRNTAPACALIAFILERSDPDAVLGIFPSDHFVGNPKRFAEIIAAGIHLAAVPGNIVVLGIIPTRPETGYGYIEMGALIEDEAAPADSVPIGVHRVRRFREKPDPATAASFLATGNFAWNGGIFLWSARTLAAAVREYMPDTAPIMESIASAYGTPQFESVFAREYPQCESISVDYAILERRAAIGQHRSHI